MVLPSPWDFRGDPPDAQADLLRVVPYFCGATTNWYASTVPLLVASELGTYP